MAFQDSAFQNDAFQIDEVVVTSWVLEGAAVNPAWSETAAAAGGWTKENPNSATWTKQANVTDGWIVDQPTDGNWQE